MEKLLLGITIAVQFFWIITSNRVFDNSGFFSTTFLFICPDFRLDPEVLAGLQPWQKLIDAKGMQAVGHSESILLKSQCVVEECKLGIFVADAYVHHYKRSLCAKRDNLCTSQIIGMVNSGAIRANLNAGRGLFFTFCFCISI